MLACNTGRHRVATTFAVWFCAIACCRVGSARTVETALDRYVTKPDSTYSWRVASKSQKGGATQFVVDLKSQTWRSAARRPPILPPVFPGLDRIRVRPQATEFLSGLALSVGEFAGFVVSDIAPGEAVADHFQVDEAVPKIDATDLAPVSVDIHDLDANDLAEHFGGQVLPGFGPERLALFGGVDAMQADLVLHFGVVEHGQTVAVGDRHDLARDRLGLVSQQCEGGDEAKLEHGRIVPIAFERCAPQNRGALF
jgi:hypothetical protein